MALKRLTIDGYGQLEINNAAFRRDGRIEAQLPLDATDFASIPAENGMLLAVDRVGGSVKLAKTGVTAPIAINYSAEHIYETRNNGLKDFKLNIDEFYPRLGYPSVADIYTTNCVCYDDSEFDDDDDFKNAVADVKTTKLYGAPCENGAIKISATAPTNAAVKLEVVRNFTMPDGQYAVQLRVIAAQ